MHRLLKNRLRTILIFIILSLPKLVCGQDTIFYDDFESGSTQWELNATDLGAIGVNAYSNQFIVNNVYGGGTLPTGYTFGCTHAGNVPAPSVVPAQSPAITGNAQSSYMHMYFADMLPPYNCVYITNPGPTIFTPNSCGINGNNFSKMTNDVSTLGKSGVEFHYYWFAAVSGSRVYYSIDGGINWIFKTSHPVQNAWGTNVLTDPAFDNQPTIRFGFMFDLLGTPQALPPLGIDEVLLVVQTPLLDVNVVGTKDVTCFGGSDGAAEVEATGGTPPYTYVWKNSGGIVVSTQPGDSVMSGLSSDTYTIVVTDSAGMQDSINCTINEPPATMIDTVGTMRATCVGDPNGIAELTFSTLVGGPILYSFDGGVSFDTISVDSSLAGNILAIGEDQNGCRDSMMFFISGDSITVSFSNDIAVCPGDSGLSAYQIMGGAAPYSLQWSDLDGLIVNDTSQEVVVFPTQDYVLQLIATDSTGCPSLQGSMNVDLLDLPDIQVDTIIEMIQDSFVTIDILSNLGVSFTWRPSIGLSDSVSSTVIANPDSSLYYVVTVVSDSGCVDSVRIFVDVVPSDEIIIYSSFTPNGDGKNDSWVIDGITGLDGVYVRIFGRWGNTFYETYDYANNPWNGNLQNSSEPLGAGTYYYIVKLPDGRHFKGGIVLFK